jgi:GR25 family glycosyltransferase involved in LPS biosynthesis
VISKYLINLDGRPDRLETSKKQLQNLGLVFQRISAIDGKNIHGNSFLTSNVLACWQSHLLAYETFLASDANYALILEDDFEICKPSKFEKNLQKWSSVEYDLVQIGFLVPGFYNKFKYIFEEIEKGFFNLLSKFFSLMKFHSLGSRLRISEASTTPIWMTASSFLPGTHAYLISRSLAEAIVMEGASNLSADEYFIALSKMRSFKIGRLWKSHVEQNGSEPSIQIRFTREEIG